DKPLVVASDDDEPLGLHPESGLPIYLKKGPYGWYVQMGIKSEDLPAPKRAALERGDKPEEITFERAVKLLELPRDVGIHEGEMISAGVGRFGPFVKHRSLYVSLGEM
ncbi:MAG: topoisomerase C-terminal repeat-containing protein, partial [Chloroflexota bacterium]